MNLIKLLNEESKLIELQKRKPKPEDVDENSIEIAGIDTKDYPDFVDAYIQSADWKDTGKPLTDEEIDYLSANFEDWVYDIVYNQAVGA